MISTPRQTLLVAAVVMATLAVTVARSGEIEPAAEQQRTRPTTTSLHRGPEMSAGTLSITVNGLRQSHGTVLVGLYDSRASFDRAIELASDTGFLNDADRVAGAALRANGMLRGGVTFHNLPPGRYAVILFQDENDTGRLAKNFWGGFRPNPMASAIMRKECSGAELRGGRLIARR